MNKRLHRRSRKPDQPLPGDDGDPAGHGETPASASASAPASATTPDTAPASTATSVSTVTAAAPPEVAPFSLDEEALQLGARSEELAARINDLETFIVTSPREATLQRLRTIDIVPPSEDDGGPGTRRHRLATATATAPAPAWLDFANAGAGSNDSEDTGRLTHSQRLRLRQTQLRHLVMFLLVLAAGAALLAWIAHYFQ